MSWDTDGDIIYIMDAGEVIMRISGSEFIGVKKSLKLKG
jgi:hypothetical protein